MFESGDDREGAVDDSKERTEEPQGEEEDVVASVRGQAPGRGTARDKKYMNTHICTNALDFSFPHTPGYRVKVEKLM